MKYGWKYDKTSGHAESTPDSPIGQQFGVVLVTRIFATDALAMFPALVEVLNEAQLEEFWNTKAYGHVPADRVDVAALQALKIERDLRTDLGQETTALDTRILQALDPNDPHPGKRKEHMKTWADAKVRLGVTIGTLP
jgi:hypothetical protein